MNLQELQNKKQQYLNEKNNLENEKNNYIKDLAVIENQIETNDNILMSQFGTKEVDKLQEILVNLENELQQLEVQYSDLKSGKISASSFGDTSTSQFQNETKPTVNTEANVYAPAAVNIPTPPLQQQPNYPAYNGDQLQQQPNYPAYNGDQLQQQPNYQQTVVLQPQTIQPQVQPTTIVPPVTPAAPTPPQFVMPEIPNVR